MGIQTLFDGSILFSSIHTRFKHANAKQREKANILEMKSVFGCLPHP